jgi:endonuclease YncB( thermonuclease family)
MKIAAFVLGLSIASTQVDPSVAQIDISDSGALAQRRTDNKNAEGDGRSQSYVRSFADGDTLYLRGVPLGEFDVRTATVEDIHPGSRSDR